MGLFYHALGLALMQLGSNLVTNVIPDYETPQIPVSISLALSSGLLEESVFFGIPFYLTGNSIVLFGTGIIWSVSHLFNSGNTSLESLAYGGFLFSVPHIFFSLRIAIISILASLILILAKDKSHPYWSCSLPQNRLSHKL